MQLRQTLKKLAVATCLGNYAVPIPTPWGLAVVTTLQNLQLRPTLETMQIQFPPLGLAVATGLEKREVVIAP
jgi:hypothetical protein